MSLNPFHTSKPTSLQRTILGRLFVVSLLVFTLMLIFLYFRIERAIFRSFDSELAAYVQSLTILSHIDESGQYELDFADEVMGDFSGENSRAHFAIFRLSDGAEMERSRSLQSFSLHLPFAFTTFKIGDPLFWNTTIHEKTIRFMAVCETVQIEQDEKGEENSHSMESSVSIQSTKTISSPIKTDYLFLVGMDCREIDEWLREIALLSYIFMGSGLILLLIVGGWVVAKGLQPLRVLENEVRAISPTNLIPISISPVVELAQISRTFNIVISNLKEAFERERRFTADVAHELRTPISEIRTAAEVALNDPAHLETTHRNTLDDILASTKKMQQIVHTLLTLARYDSGKLHSLQESVPIKPFLLSIWNSFEEKASLRGLEVRYEILGDASMLSDPGLLETLFVNLFENAVDYTPPQGTIEWKTVVGDKDFFFQLSNTVLNLSAEDIPHLCDRFWQKEAARSTNDNHCGLGLSLVRSLADTLNLSMQIRLVDSNRLEISLNSNSFLV